VIKDPRAVEPLIAALEDTDSSVRAKAASALGEIRDLRAVGALIAALKDTDSSVRAEAASALGKIKDPARLSS
jgi:HEAT repeat protein